MDVYENQILTGYQKNASLLRIWFAVARQLIKKYPNPIKLYIILSRINVMLKNSGVKKIALIDKKYYLSPNFQAFPSKHFFNYVFYQAKKALNTEVKVTDDIQLAIVSITKKCPLNCEHCCEADELNKKEVLSLSDLKMIIGKLQKAGVPHFVLGGGEPTARIKDLILLLESANKNADFWIMTSGFNFTEENAFKLKKAGLAGVSISLDHYDEHGHNYFRRHPDAFQWVMNAVKNAHKAQLGTAFTLCATREFCTPENLLKYAELTRKMGVPFIQILEPSAVGNYAGKDVILKPEHIKILDEFHRLMNDDPNYAEYPIVLYHGLENRKVGCMGSGSRFLYVDTNGDANTCPMCRKRSGNLIKDDLEDIILGLKATGCSKFADFIFD